MKHQVNSVSIQKLPWKYCWFVAWNWGVSMAVKLWKDEYYGMRNYGLFPAEHLSLHDLSHDESPHQDHTFFMPVSYRVLERIFPMIQSLQVRHMVDVGAGEGRALAVAAHFGMERLTAIEVHPKLAKRCRDQLNLIQHHFPAVRTSVIPSRFQDATLPPHTDLLFLFNPFGEKSMEDLIEQIETQIPNEQPLYVAYVNPVWINCWLRNGYSLLQQDVSDRYFQFALLKRNSSTA